MKADIPWLRILVEGAVIVVSILLAFGIDAWWDGRQQREEELRLLVRLDAELARAERQISNRVGGYERVTKGTEPILQHLLTSPGTTLPDSLASNAEYLLYLFNSINLQTGALDGALASGQIGLVSNEALRSALASLPSIFDEFVETEDAIGALLDEVRAAGRPDLDLAPAILGGLFAESFPSVPPARSESARQSVMDFLRTPTGQNLLVMRYSHERIGVRDGAIALRAVQQTRALIADELGRPATP